MSQDEQSIEQRIALGPAPVDDTAARLAAAEDRVRVLEGAMRWYADEQNWRLPMQVEMANADDPPTSDAQADAGERARAALAKKSEGT